MVLPTVIEPGCEARRLVPVLTCEGGHVLYGDFAGMTGELTGRVSYTLGQSFATLTAY